MKLQEKAKEELEKKLSNINSGNIISVPKRVITEDEIIDEEETPIIQDDIENTQNDKNNENFKTFLSFINVATIKGNLYKSYLDKVEKYDKKISLCRDFKNRIEIYFGPYESQEERLKVFNLLIENGFKEAYLVDFTDEEYNKRCNY